MKAITIVIAAVALMSYVTFAGSTGYETLTLDHEISSPARA